MLTNRWQKSSKCPPLPGCVEVKKEGETIFIRDDKDRQVTIQTNTASWKAFINGVKRGEFDLT